MSKFIHPAPNARLTSTFGYRTIAGKKEWHQGIDLARKGNVPILAAADGIVREVWGEKVSSYGNVIFLQHTINGKRMDTTYAHLKSISVKKGMKVVQGQVIGYMGNTGRSYGQHLHFEIHNGPWAKGQPNAVDPWPFISKKVSKPEPKPNKPEPKKTLQSGAYKTEAEAKKAIVAIRNKYKLNYQYNYHYKDGDVWRWRTGSFDEARAQAMRKEIVQTGIAKVVHVK